MGFLKALSNKRVPQGFLLVMEAFSFLLRRAIECGFILGFGAREGGRGVEIYHLLFTYDTLLFSDPCPDQLTYTAWVLLWFDASSRLKINLNKSEHIPIGNIPNVEELASALGCGVGKLPTTYLGLPIVAPFKAKAIWDVVEERFFKRLTLWKRHYFSKGGKITLLKSTFRYS